MQPILGTTKGDPKSKPAIYKAYDFTKGGTDIVDQRIRFYTRKFRSCRWTMTGFAYMLGTSRVNASTIVAMNTGKDPRKQSSFDFGMTLVSQLLRPFIQMRALWGLPKNIKEKIRISLGEPIEPPGDSSQCCAYPPQAEKKRRCKVCENDPIITRSKRDNLGKVLSQCQRCSKPVCKKRYFRFCEMCQ